MKYAYIPMAAIFLAVLSSCCGPCPAPQPGKPTCCSSPANADSPKGKICLPNVAGMPASCAGNCSGNDCGCVKHPCRCAVKKPAPAKKPVAVAAKPTPAKTPAPEVIALVPPPAPPPAPAPPPEPAFRQVTTFGEYREYSGQVHKVTLDPSGAPDGKMIYGPQDRTVITSRTTRIENIPPK